MVEEAIGHMPTIALFPSAAGGPRPDYLTYPLTFSNPLLLEKAFGSDMPAPELFIYCGRSVPKTIRDAVLHADVAGASRGSTRISTRAIEEWRLQGRRAWLLRLGMEHRGREVPWAGQRFVLWAATSDGAVTRAATDEGLRFDLLITVADCTRRAEDAACLNELRRSGPLWRNGLLDAPPRFWLTDHVRHTDAVTAEPGAIIHSRSRAFPLALRVRGSFNTRWAACGRAEGGVGSQRILLLQPEVADATAARAKRAALSRPSEVATEDRHPGIPVGATAPLFNRVAVATNPGSDSSPVDSAAVFELDNA